MGRQGGGASRGYGSRVGGVGDVVVVRVRVVLVLPVGVGGSVSYRNLELP